MILKIKWLEFQFFASVDQFKQRRGIWGINWELGEIFAFPDSSGSVVGDPIFDPNDRKWQNIPHEHFDLIALLLSGIRYGSKDRYER